MSAWARDRQKIDVCFIYVCYFFFVNVFPGQYDVPRCKFCYRGIYTRATWSHTTVPYNDAKKYLTIICSYIFLCYGLQSPATYSKTVNIYKLCRTEKALMDSPQSSPEQSRLGRRGVAPLLHHGLGHATGVRVGPGTEIVFQGLFGKASRYFSQG